MTHEEAIKKLYDLMSTVGDALEGINERVRILEDELNKMKNL